MEKNIATNQELINELEILASDLEEQSSGFINELFRSAAEHRPFNKGNISTTAPAAMTVAGLLRDIITQIENAGEKDFKPVVKIVPKAKVATLVVNDATKEVFEEIGEVKDPEILTYKLL